MSGSAELRSFRAALAGAGLDLTGVLAPAVYDRIVPGALQTARLLPGARAAIVIGSAGGALWEAFRRAPPPGPDPLDTFTERAVEDATGALPPPVRVLLGHRPVAGSLPDLVALARACGLGHPSRLGLLLHPVAGPWISLRAVVLTRQFWPPASPLSGPSPCEACPAPCTEVCPARAPGAAGFDVAACAGNRREDSACSGRCAARHACPVGASHAYPAEAETHHMLASLAAVSALG